MSVKRFFRVLFGLVLLAAFVYCQYFYYQTAPKILEPDTWMSAETAEPEESARPAPTAAPTEDVAAPTEEAAQPTEEAPAETPQPTEDPDSPAGRAAAMGLPAPPDIGL